MGNKQSGAGSKADTRTLGYETLVTLPGEEAEQLKSESQMLLLPRKTIISFFLPDFFKSSIYFLNWLGFRIGYKPSQLLVWCSRKNNKISGISFETKRKISDFDGVHLTKKDRILNYSLILVIGKIWKGIAAGLMWRRYLIQGFLYLFIILGTLLPIWWYLISLIKDKWEKFILLKKSREVNIDIIF